MAELKMSANRAEVLRGVADRQVYDRGGRSYLYTPYIDTLADHLTACRTETDCTPGGELMSPAAVTAANLTVEHGAAPWGGPTATVTINAGPFAGRTFWLRSTEGMDRAGDLTKGGGIHVSATDPDRAGRHDWRGALKTFNMGDAINDLVGYINGLADRRQVEEATYSPLSELHNALGDFGTALEESSPRDYRDEWQRVRDAVAQIEMAMEETGRA